MAEFVMDADVDPRKSTLPFVIPILCTGLFSIFLTFCCIFCWVYYPTVKEKFVLFYEAVIGYISRSFRPGRAGRRAQENILLRRRRARGNPSSLGPQRRKVKGQYGSIRPQRRKVPGGSVLSRRQETPNASLRPQVMEASGSGTRCLPQRLEAEGPVNSRLPQRLENIDSIAGPLRTEAQCQDGCHHPQARCQDDGCSLGINIPDQEALGREALTEATEKICLLCKGEGPTHVRRMRNSKISNSL